jgi:hypothetical protein
MLALTSPTSVGRSVGIVRSRIQATELVCFLLLGERTGLSVVLMESFRHSADVLYASDDLGTIPHTGTEVRVLSGSVWRLHIALETFMNLMTAYGLGALETFMNLMTAYGLGALETFMNLMTAYGPLWSSGQSSWLQIRRPGFDSRHYQKRNSWVWNGVHSASRVLLRSYLIEK